MSPMHIKRAAPLLASRLALRVTGQVARPRQYATQPAPPPPPNAPPHEPSRVGAYYKSFGSPVLKCFLGALFTYQIAYYAWLKLETIEEVHDKSAEISDLQHELKRAVAQQTRRAREGVSQAVDAVAEAKDKMVDGVREATDEASKATGAVSKVAQGGWWPW